PLNAPRPNCCTSRSWWKRALPEIPLEVVNPPLSPAHDHDEVPLGPQLLAPPTLRVRHPTTLLPLDLEIQRVPAFPSHRQAEIGPARLHAFGLEALGLAVGRPRPVRHGKE